MPDPDDRYGIRPHLPMTAEDHELARRFAEQTTISPEQIEDLKRSITQPDPDVRVIHDLELLSVSLDAGPSLYDVPPPAATPPAAMDELDGWYDSLDDLTLPGLPSARKTAGVLTAALAAILIARKLRSIRRRPVALEYAHTLTDLIGRDRG